MPDSQQETPPGHSGPSHSPSGHSPWRSGIDFGLTSGVITTLGLIVGLHAGTHSTLAVIGGILTIAIADAMSDALGMHIAKEAEHQYDDRQIWLVTLTTFFTKAIVALSFAVPVFFLALPVAIGISVAWGLLILTVLSYHMARSQGVAPWRVIGEHLFIAVLVILLTHALGEWVAEVFS